MQPLQDYVAAKLLQVKAIKLQPHNPFVWGNGWVSPIYFDSRKLLSYPTIRNAIKVQMSRAVLEQYPEAEVIVSVAPNAIAIGMLVAEVLGLPFVYIHPKPKDHGFENMIEGDLRPRQNVVVIDDQISAGTYSIKVADVVKHNGCQVLGVVSIFNYELTETTIQLREEGINLTSLTNFFAVLKRAIEIKYIKQEDLTIFHNWQQDPLKWQK
ncbi:MAG: orotate phosphoribosyltransferase [Paludibacteraceae bacterium]|nr:orotate phosphoribosyltransferase [Paludibacteraceae bacterium]